MMTETEETFDWAYLKFCLIFNLLTKFLLLAWTSVTECTVETQRIQKCKEQDARGRCHCAGMLHCENVKTRILSPNERCDSHVIAQGSSACMFPSFPQPLHCFYFVRHFCVLRFFKIKAGYFCCI